MCIDVCICLSTHCFDSVKKYTEVSKPRPKFLRPRLRLLGSGLETETKTFGLRSRDQDRDLETWDRELECTRVSGPWSRDHNTADKILPQSSFGTIFCLWYVGTRKHTNTFSLANFDLAWQSYKCQLIHKWKDRYTFVNLNEIWQLSIHFMYSDDWYADFAVHAPFIRQPSRTLSDVQTTQAANHTRLRSTGLQTTQGYQMPVPSLHSRSSQYEVWLQQLCGQTCSRKKNISMNNEYITVQYNDNMR